MTDDADGTAALLDAAAARAMCCRRGLADRPVAPTPEAVAGVARLREPLPDSGVPAEATLALIDEVRSAASMAMAGPRFFGFVISVSSWETTDEDVERSLDTMLRLARETA